MADLTFPTHVIVETSRGIDLIEVTDALYDKRDVYLVGEVDQTSATQLFKQLMYLEKTEPGTPINLYINSPGGSVTDGMFVYDFIRNMESPVTTICIGRAASMGAMLFLAGDTRKMYEHSEIMIHDASFGNADFSGLKPDEIREKSDKLLETCKILRSIVAERTGMTDEEVTEKMKKDSYFKANEAVENGLATEIIKKK